MEKDILINKLLLNMAEFNLPIETALDQAFVGGIDYARHTMFNHNQRKILYFNKNGALINTFNSIAEAGRKLKIGRGTIDDILYGKTKGRRNTGNYFRYATYENTL